MDDNSARRKPFSSNSRGRNARMQPYAVSLSSTAPGLNTGHNIDMRTLFGIQFSARVGVHLKEAGSMIWHRQAPARSPMAVALPLATRTASLSRICTMKSLQKILLYALCPSPFIPIDSCTHPIDFCALENFWSDRQFGWCADHQGTITNLQHPTRIPSLLGGEDGGSILVKFGWSFTSVLVHWSSV